MKICISLAAHSILSDLYGSSSHSSRAGRYEQTSGFQCICEQSELICKLTLESYCFLIIFCFLFLSLFLFIMVLWLWYNIWWLSRYSAVFTFIFFYRYMDCSCSWGSELFTTFIWLMFPIMYHCLAGLYYNKIFVCIIIIFISLSSFVLYGYKYIYVYYTYDWIHASYKVPQFFPLLCIAQQGWRRITIWPHIKSQTLFDCQNYLGTVEFSVASHVFKTD